MGIFSLYCFIIVMVVFRNLAKHLSIKYLPKDSTIRKIWIEEDSDQGQK